MLNSYDILKAMDGVDGRQVKKAGELLGYMEHRPSRAKKLWRTALLAAIIAAFLGVTAYAAGWLGLSGRVQPAEPLMSPPPLVSMPPREPGGFISSNGYTDSPAALAHKEWLEFSFGYVDEHPDIFAGDDWRSGDPELDKYALMYGAFDQTMLDKLLEIRDKYSVSLHSEKKLMFNTEMFHRITGTENFIISDKIRDDGTQTHYVYEDGSFYIQCFADIDGEEHSISLSRGRQNMLDPLGNYVYDVAQYQEESYTNISGDELCLSVMKDLTGVSDNSFVFYDTDDYVVIVRASTANAKAVADMFDFEAACHGETDLSALIDPKPAEAKKKEGLLTMEEFMETPEYRASTEFQAAYTELKMAELLERAPEAYPQEFFYYGAFPMEYSELNLKLEDIISRYPLAMPVNGRAVHWERWIQPEYLFSHSSTLSYDGEWPSAEASDYWKLMDTEPFLFEGYPFHTMRWDNGCRQFAFAFAHGSSELAYIPKGSFYPILVGLKVQGHGWAYDTACGEQVYIFALDEIAVGQNAYILYETDSAYVVVNSCGSNDDLYTQAVADNIDFTKFK